MNPGDIRDIRGPIAIPYWWMPFAIALAVVAGLAILFAIVRYVRRRLAERAKSAAELALERLDRARLLAETQSSAAFSSEVSDAVRDYIEAAFGLRAAHRTTEEFLRELVEASDTPIATHRGALEDFLSWCDLAKFARLAIGGEHANAMIDAARRFVTSTDPTKAPRVASKRGRTNEDTATSEPARKEVGT